MQSETTVSALTRFNEAINELFSSQDPRNISTLKFIHSRIKQFNLNCDINSVVSECYLRGIRLIQKGEKIHNPLAWIRATSYNIIRERSRKKRKVIVNSLVIENCLADTSTEDVAISCQAELSLLKKAIAKLSPEDQAILEMRWIKELSWNEVAQIISLEGKQLGVDALRKRGQRAFTRLRSLYKAMEQG
jgi:RNA polymerase sigma factor (sigma-70 family)